jgi:hypothetical protein
MSIARIFLNKRSPRSKDVYRSLPEVRTYSSFNRCYLRTCLDNVLTSGVVEGGFEALSDNTKDYKIGIIAASPLST